MANILVVDDEPSIRQLLRVTLGDAHRVEEAADGSEGLRRLRERPQDIVMLDVAMPVMDGLSACRAIRADPALGHVGIIVVSAFANRDEALAAGADRHFRKPFRPLMLLAAINEMLEAANRGGRLNAGDG